VNRPVARLEIKRLEELYLKQTELLKQSIQSGAPKRMIKKQREKVIKLAHAIHEKNNSTRVPFS